MRTQAVRVPSLQSLQGPLQQFQVPLLETVWATGKALAAMGKVRDGGTDDDGTHALHAPACCLDHGHVQLYLCATSATAATHHRPVLVHGCSITSTCSSSSSMRGVQSVQMHLYRNLQPHFLMHLLMS